MPTNPTREGSNSGRKSNTETPVDVICAAVLDPITRPEAVVAGLPIDGELRIVERSAPLKAAAAKMLGSPMAG
ncbi:hypothetical protein ACMX2H_11550 [Arthrobacter sulfonylureivorans]|uniref:hypothetical protein n=1 Tax=Arthrobacter sulfonylureivorans TaxID=2486855 RepID=UPI0039E54B19